MIRTGTEECAVPLPPQSNFKYKRQMEAPALKLIPRKKKFRATCYLCIKCVDLHIILETGSTIMNILSPLWLKQIFGLSTSYNLL
jgi:hypothetical protein